MKRIIITLISFVLLVIAVPFIAHAVGGVRKCFYVVSNESEPIVGATAQIKGTTTYAVADLYGKICIVGEPTDTVVISMVGYLSFEIPFNAIGNQIILGEDDPS